MTKVLNSIMVLLPLMALLLVAPSVQREGLYIPTMPMQGDAIPLVA